MVHLPEELDHLPDERRLVVVRHRAARRPCPTSRVVAEAHRDLLDDVGRDAQVGAADDDDLGARVAHLQVLVDRGDLPGAALLDVDVHPGPPVGRRARERGGVVRAAAGDDDDLDDARELRPLLEERLEHVLDVGRLVVGGDDDGDVHFTARPACWRSK